MKKDILKVFTTNLIKMFVSLTAAFFIPAILTLDEYGSYKLYALYASYIGIAHLGFCDGIYLRYGGKQLQDISKERLSSEQSSIILFQIAISLGILFFGIVRRDAIIILLAVSILPTTMITYYTYVYQAIGEFTLYSKIYGALSLLTLIIDVVLVFLVKSSVAFPYIIAEIGVKYLVFAGAATSFNRKGKIGLGKFSSHVLVDEMKAGVLLMVGNMSYILFTSIDKWFVKGLLGMTEFAYYSFAVQLLSLINMFVNPIALTFYSYLSRRKDQEFEYKIKCCLALIFMFMLNGVYVLRFIIRVWIPKYDNTIHLVIILFLAQVFMSLNTALYVNLFKVYKMQRKYFVNLIIALGVSIVLNVGSFVIFRSSQSIAMATLASMIIWSLINLRDFNYLKFDGRHLVYVILMSVLFIITSLTAREIVGICLYFIGWIFLSIVFSKKEFLFLWRQLLSVKKTIHNNSKKVEGQK